MSIETKESGMLSLPRLWNLVIGYEEETETYTVNHGRCGTFKIRYDAFGHRFDGVWIIYLRITTRTN